MIISVGYRVSSEKATKFRIWATQTLRNYIIKGYAIDDERLKQGTNDHLNSKKKMGKKLVVSIKNGLSIRLFLFTLEKSVENLTNNF